MKFIQLRVLVCASVAPFSRIWPIVLDKILDDLTIGRVHEIRRSSANHWPVAAKGRLVHVEAFEALDT